ncbi:MAG: hypothetical protein HGA97_06360 [Chlorobiaceae bacterium]|nr:hypothetical protein [Chlorobiaceae bacterium]
MSGDRATSGEKTGLLWAASLVATALVTLVATLFFQNASLINRDSSSSKRQALVADMRVNLARSAEKEKCAVMATGDEQSANFAEQSKSAAREVDRDLKRLESIITRSGSDKEKNLVAKFTKSWKEVQHIDTALLEAAMQNTNVKALGLSNSIGAEMQRKIDDNLAKLSARVNPETKKTQMDKLSSDARIAIRTIAILQTRHVDAGAIPDKKGIEAAMKAEQAKVNTALKSLDRLTGKKNRGYIREAMTGFSEFMRVNEEIVRLSTLNTNKITVEISLGKKRMVEAECTRTLESLQKLVAEKP